MADQGLRSADVIGNHRHAVIKHMVDGHHRQRGIHQLQDLRIAEIHTGDNDAVQAAVAAVLEISRRLIPSVAVNEGNVVSPGLGLLLQAVQNGGEVLVRQAAAALIHKEHADVIGTVRFQGPSGGVGQVTHFVRSPKDALPGLPADILLPV